MPTTGTPAERTTARTASSASRRPELGHHLGFWVIAVAFLSVMAFSTVPTPLYAIYQQRDGFPAFVVTVIFAAYAVGVVASLFLAGHVSDWLGRRRILLAAILVEVLASIVFLLWPDVPGLIVARLLTGIGVGALTATATAHLSELRAIARPEEGPGASRAVSTLVNVGGLALGPLIGGVLAVTVDRPLVVPYEVFLVLLVVLGIAVALVPETVERREELPAYRPQRLAVPAASRGTFLSAAVGAFAGFAVFGLFTSLAPTFLAGRFGETSHLLAGVVSFGVFAAGAVAQLTAARLPVRRALLLSATALTVGLVLVAWGAVAVVLPAFIGGGVIAGAGVGLIFRLALGVAGSLASDETRGEVLAGMFLASYVGLAVPVLLIGAALAVFPAVPVLVGFVAIVLALVLVAIARMLRSAV
ncbi:MFS transporter [Rathayibacter festucae]|uniref:MFS transporter n=1 Tax=Rathayibacter festucae TaxID=110937 RepID=A0ABX6GXY5_9MICO|nr:MFS transporter [Rathayibacter festucae]QHC62308.1 MFS transporter [Rathayibacter festucae]